MGPWPSQAWSLKPVLKHYRVHRNPCGVTVDPHMLYNPGAFETGPLIESGSTTLCSKTVTQSLTPHERRDGSCPFEHRPDFTSGRPDVLQYSDSDALSAFQDSLCAFRVRCTVTGKARRGVPYTNMLTSPISVKVCDGGESRHESVHPSKQSFC